MRTAVRTWRTGAGAAAVLALGGVLLTAGCGIKPTGVVESGQPAQVPVVMSPYATQVYFLSPTGGLVPVPESGYPPSPPVDVLGRLLRGPGEAARAAGLHTELPALTGPQEGGPAWSAGPQVGGPSWSVEYDGNAEVTVRVPFAVRPLSTGARLQLVCTAAHTTGRSAFDVEVTLLGPDGALPAAHCPRG
ncbi:hypothetical protein [Streptomyces sp. WAC06614]|uniref:hypothetical protein n=1 Tax=Streptomyces sp. WAC06614 TaxID=2487416 RepID=UPI000F7B519D|nr:hypothetical protein [Streptomyces sp. WAC06614]RSS83237.1 hypothetical protein EF918_04300 [Streptomyces sp. WAC06614]